MNVRCNRSNLQEKIVWTNSSFYFLTPLSAIGNFSCHPIFLIPKYKNSNFCSLFALYSLNQLVNNFGLKITNFQSLAFNGLIVNSFSVLISVFIIFVSTSALSNVFAKSVAVFNVSVVSANNRQRILLFIMPHTNLSRNTSSKNFRKVAI